MQAKHVALAFALAVSTPVFAAPFEISASGQEVTDVATGLVWLRCVEGMQWDGTDCTGQALKFSFDGARLRAQSVAGAAKAAWRVPTNAELVALLDRAPGTPARSSNIFPTAPLTSHWSSVPYTNDGMRGTYVHFGNGTEAGDYRSSQFNVRLVRRK